MAKKWLPIVCFPGQPMLVAPAELAITWPGNKATGDVKLEFTYWQPFLKDLKKSHPELKFEGSSARPFVRLREADVKGVNDKLLAFLKARFPDLRKKKQKATMFFHYENHYACTDAHPISAADTLLATSTRKPAWNVDVDGKQLLVWQPETGEVRARVTDDGFVLLDHDADRHIGDAEPGDAALDALVKGKATSYGTWTFGKGLAVAHPAHFAITECRGLETGKLPAIEAVVAKKPTTLVRSVEDPQWRQGVVLKIPAGSYRIETGGDKKARWLRAVRCS
jgi:hypothetical protein